MEQYKNLSGDSGIVYYEITEDSISVQFGDGTTYLYSYQTSGRDNVEQMKALAQQGKGLNSFIMKNIRVL